MPSPAVNGGSGGTSEIVGEDGSVSNVLLVLMTLTAVASIVVLLIAFGRHLYLARCTRADELSGISHPGISSKRQPKADLVEGEADMVSLCSLLTVRFASMFVLKTKLSCVLTCSHCAKT